MTAAAPPSLGISLLFFVSGVLALVYEVLWQRRFGLLFGSAAPATAAVLAAYFAGLAAGSLTLGRLSRRWTRPLKIYALLELVIAGGAILVPVLLEAFAPLYRALSQTWATSPSLLLGSKVALGFVAVGLPTFCMGGTLPILAELVDQGERRVGWTVGRLYLANTLGAAVGALLVPFVLMRFMGIGASEWVAVLGNVAISLIAWRWDAAIYRKSPTKDPAPLRSSARSAAGHGSAMPWVEWTLAGVSGAVTLALQVLWNRAFAQVHENSIYSFAIIVGLFVLALALGAQAARVFLRRDTAPEQVLGWAWVAASALTAAGPAVFLHLTDNLSYIPASGGWTHYGLRLILLAGAVLLLPIGLLGMGLPAIMDRSCRGESDQSVSHLLGSLLAVNVLASVLGALLAGFCLPSWLGLWRSILGISVLLLLCGWTQLVQRSGGRNPIQLALIVFAAVGIAFAFRAERGWLGLQVLAAQKESVVQVLEGSYGIVSVIDRGDSRRLKLNNHYMLGGTLSTGDERMQTHLPLLMHPSPSQVAFLGIGTGITAGGAMFHPLEEAVAVELVPEVIQAARTHFKAANAGILDSPKTQVVLEDARNYLRTTPRKFDVIVSDLVVPWRQGEGSLFTLEHFIAARDRLKPGGIFCQWLPLFQLSETEVNILVRTFLTAFPRAWVWRGDFSPQQPALALVGADPSFQLSPETVERRLRQMTPDPQNPHLSTPFVFWMHFLGSITAADLTTHESRINREDRPWVEILGPLLHAGESRSELCTGRRFQGWIRKTWPNPVSENSAIHTTVAPSAEAGEIMYEFSLQLSEGNQAGVREAQSRLREKVPSEVYRSLFGEAR